MPPLVCCWIFEISASLCIRRFTGTTRTRGEPCALSLVYGAQLHAQFLHNASLLRFDRATTFRADGQSRAQYFERETHRQRIKVAWRGGRTSLKILWVSLSCSLTMEFMQMITDKGPSHQSCHWRGADPALLHGCHFFLAHGQRFRGRRSPGGGHLLLQRRQNAWLHVHWSTKGIISRFSLKNIIRKKIFWRKCVAENKFLYSKQ